MCSSPVPKSASPNVRMMNDREIKKLLWASLTYVVLLPFRILLGKTHCLPSSETRSRILHRLSGPVAHRYVDSSIGLIMAPEYVHLPPVIVCLATCNVLPLQRRATGEHTRSHSTKQGTGRCSN